MTLYPDGIDSILQLPDVPGSDGYVVAINASKDAIIAVETELGLDPAGIYSDVATRLSVLEGRIGPGATITGGPIDINDANLTGVLDVIRGGTGLNLASAMANPNAALISTGLPTPGIAYSLISDVHIDPAAAIDVTKLAAGANTYVLTTNTGIPTWMPTGSNTFIASGDLSGTPILQTVIGLQGTPVDATAPTDGYVLTYDLADGYWHAAAAPTGFSAGTDLSGTATNQTVIAIQNVPVNATAPADGYVLTYDLADGYWHAAATAVAITLPLTAPDGGTGFNAAYLTANPDEALVINGAGTNITSIPIINLPLPLADLDPAGATDGYVVTRIAGVWSSTIPTTTMLGDVTGSSDTNTVVAIQSVPVNATAPDDGYVLTYDLADGYWHPARISALSSPIITGTVIYQGTRMRILSIPGELQTTNGTDGYIVSFTMLNETMCAFDVVVCAALQTNVTDGGRWKRSVVYRRTGGGAPTIVGTLESGTDQEVTAGLDVTIDQNGVDTVRVRVTGIAATNFNWTAELRVQETVATP